MNDVMITSLRSYWERLRAGRIAPYRAEIDPREFESALENMFIIERIAPGNFRIRLAGLKICEIAGMEVRGMEPSHLIAEPDQARFERLLGVVMTEPAVVELGLETEPRPVISRATMLLMPLRSDFGEINRVLGCASLDGTFYPPPVAFLIKDISISPVQVATPEASNRSQALPGFAEDVLGFEAPESAPRLRAIEGNPDAAPDKRSRPKLRVVDND
ncbi:MAG TPA: PAS domain-containing protein [Paracoccaceae bacterium]|nr:PAS domain-containing protein [Paracoccaceae bacterium]